jgi:hypothetical protein
MVRIGAVLVMLLALSGCGSDDGDSANDTTAEPGSTTTLLLPTTAPSTGGATSTTAKPPKLTLPDAAAKHLYAMWKVNDEDGALLYATKSAVDTLFAHPYTGPEQEFMGCTPTGSTWDCAYLYEGGSTHFTVEGSAADGYRVTKVQQVAD